MIRRPPRSTLDRSSAASDVYKRQGPLVRFHDRLLVSSSRFIIHDSFLSSLYPPVTGRGIHVGVGVGVADAVAVAVTVTVGVGVSGRGVTAGMRVSTKVGVDVGSLVAVVAGVGVGTGAKHARNASIISTRNNTNIVTGILYLTSPSYKSQARRAQLRPLNSRPRR